MQTSIFVLLFEIKFKIIENIDIIYYFSVCRYTLNDFINFLTTKLLFNICFRYSLYALAEDLFHFVFDFFLLWKYAYLVANNKKKIEDQEPRWLASQNSGFFINFKLQSQSVDLKTFIVTDSLYNQYNILLF